LIAKKVEVDIPCIDGLVDAFLKVKNATLNGGYHLHLENIIGFYEHHKEN
jgi:hypothetical protein